MTGAGGGGYEWDDAKARANLAKHGVAFSAVADFRWDVALTIPHSREDEARFLSYAPVGQRLHALVWTWRGGCVRVISLRRANTRETTYYEIRIKA